MTTGAGTTATGVSNWVSTLEKLSQGKSLILLLSFCFYADIWLIAYNKDPTTLSLNGALSVARHISLQTFVIFILSYSLFMGLIFPVARKLTIAVRIFFCRSLELVGIDRNERLLVDWSFAVVVLVAVDAIAGWWAAPHAYRGFALFIGSILAPDNFIVDVARVCIALCCLACLTFAFTADS